MEVVLSAVLEKRLSPRFLNCSRFLESILTSKKALAETARPNFVPKTTEALPALRKVAHMNECMNGGQLHVKVKGKTDCAVGATVQVVSRAWSALPKSIGLCSLQLLYSFHFLY